MLFISLISLGIAQSAIADQPSDELLISKVDAIVTKKLQEPGGVGLSIAIARGSNIILAKGYGLAEVEHDAKADAETIFRIGSVTKQFTAAAIMRLVEQGKLTLDDDMTTYLPDYPTQGHTVTIRHLLTHTSGIKSYTSVEDFWKFGQARELTHDELLAYVKDVEFDFAPGEKFLYNNTGYYLLGMIIEKVAGVPYCQYLQDEFFTPLGLTRTRCGSNTDIIHNRAQGYEFNADVLSNDAPIGMNNPGAAGILISTAHDLIVWDQALMNGKVVSEDSLKQMTTPYTLSDGTDTGYGFGLGMRDLEGHRRIGHGGGINGFNSLLGYFPDDDLYVAVISNSQGVSAPEIARAITMAALGIENTFADLAPSPDDIERFSGMYVLGSTGLEAKIFEKGGFLFMQATDQSAIKLLYQGQGEFRASFDPAVKIIFDPDGGRDFVLHQGGKEIKGKRQPDE